MDFEEIYDMYFDRVYYKILGAVKNEEDAEDIAQEVFISVYKNLKGFRQDSNLYTWIYRIAINKIYDFFRRKKESVELNDEILTIESDNDVHSSIILEEKLKKLSSQEKEIVILKDIYGYKLREISDMKGLNVSTVKTIYYKAIKDMGGAF
ncbi:RNA polymerase sigma factor [Cetobacterium sp. SF1]|uniref:RNA polymerase sigma factor n=1 Tax=unclassified Cetobacterium TaxID=2630983 RepID=UPI003CF3805F